jgi:predicted RNA-binding protein with PIN domain
MPHYYIDAYNLLFKLAIKASSLQKRREALLAILKPFAAMNLTLVFDGAEISERSHFGDLEVIYTHGESADEYIIKEIENAVKPSKHTVVTSDRPLAKTVKNLGANILSVPEFLLLISKKEKKTRVQKTFTESPYEIKRLLAIFEKKLNEI